jgi:hypothetical protein
LEPGPKTDLSQFSLFLAILLQKGGASSFFVETIQIAAEDRFVSVKLTDELIGRLVAFWEDGRRALVDVSLSEKFAILRDLLIYGFSEQYTLLCDCRHITNLDEETAKIILDLCEAGVSPICLNPCKDQLNEYARRRKVNNIRILNVRHAQSPLNYVPVASSLFEDPVDFWGWEGENVGSLNPRFRRAARNFFGIGNEEECDSAAKFVKAHYDIEAIAQTQYDDIERAEEEERALIQQDAQEFSEDLECDSKTDEGQDFGYQLDCVDDLYKVSAVASLRALRSAICKHALNSLLVEYTVQLRGTDILVTPYHAHAIHSIEAGAEVVLGRPAVIAEKTASLLASQIREFEMLLAKHRVREVEIQKYLERSPAILKALGYSHVYPQVVLQRDDGTSLRPDFIVQPTSDEWCDIVDIKLPRMRTVVGIRDRKSLAAAIHELAAQLREYAAYFEDEKLSRRLGRLYGIKCYRPRLIGVVGTDPRLADDRQIRRLMTAYSDVKVLTFDQLLRHAKSRLLI